MKMTIEQLDFPLSLKTKIMKIKNISKLSIDFVGGKNIVIDNTNLAIQEPHRIIISNKTSSVILFNYEYDDKLYSRLDNQISLSKLPIIIAKLLKWKFCRI